VNAQEENMKTQDRIAQVRKVISVTLVVGVLFAIFGSESLPRANAQGIATATPNLLTGPTLADAINLAIENHKLDTTADFYYDLVKVFEAGEWGLGKAKKIRKDTLEVIPADYSMILAHKDSDGNWRVILPEEVEPYLRLLDSFPASLLEGTTKEYIREAYKIRPRTNYSNHYLPWTKDTAAVVYQNYSDHGEGQLDFGFDGNVRTSKAGTLSFAYDAHTWNGCAGQTLTWCNTNYPDAWYYNNAVVIKHANGEYSSYLHLETNSIPSEIINNCNNGVGGICTAVNIPVGTIIGTVGNIGQSTDPHLHFGTGDLPYGRCNYEDVYDEDGDGNITETTICTGGIDGSRQISTSFHEKPYSATNCGTGIGQTPTLCMLYYPEDTNLISQNPGGSSCPGPLLINPPEGYISPSQNVGFSWSAVSGCTFNGYTFRIKDTPTMDSGGNIIQDIFDAGTSRTETISSSWNNRDLYWGVKAANATNGASWSVRRFRIELGGGSGTNIVTNGSFEVPVVRSSTFDVYGVGSTFGAWTIASGSIDHISRNYWQASDGVQSVDVTGSPGNATIYQDLVTTPQQTYQLSFDLSGNPEGSPAIKQMQVWWGSTLVDTLSFDTTGHSKWSMGWENHTYTVRATASLTRLAFTSLTTGFYGPVLDKVSVQSYSVPSPGAATLNSPSGTINTTRPTYSWNAVFGASHYLLWVNAPSGNGFIQQWFTAAAAGCPSGTGTCSATPATALATGNHTWWIRTWNNLGYGPWSAGMAFNVVLPPPPGAANLVSPNGNTTDTLPSYTWNAVSGATHYYLWVNGPSGNVIKLWYLASNVCSGGTCSVENPTALKAGVHNWWIRTWNPGGYGPWSTAMSFTVNTPGAATLVSPNGNTNDATPTYTWNEVAGATHYYLWVNAPSGNGFIKQWFKVSDGICMGGTCSATPAQGLSAGAHTWYIRTWSSAGYGAWSSGLTFSVTP
jgi:choice-of-anchor C domain-containing protein